MMCFLMGLPAVHNLFSEEEQAQIAIMGIFCAIYYGPYFLTTPIACR
jgi:hypothetical protein